MKFSAYSKESGGGAGKPDIRKAVKKIRDLVLYAKEEPEPFRIKLEKTFSSLFVPAKVDCSTENIAGIPCDIFLPEISSATRLILYIHGGSFVGGSRRSWRSFCASFATESTSRLILPEYRLAPQHAYPAALEDIQTVFHTIFARITESGISSPEIIVAADGSGASIALAFVQTLKMPFRQFIKNIVLFSPWLDISTSSPNISNKKASDGIITADSLRRSADLYTYESNLCNPLVSPLYIASEKLNDFPPVFIQCGGSELLLEDARKFHQKLTANGCICTLDIWPDMIFMFQMAHEYLPQAHFAVQRAGKYIQTYYMKQDE